MNVLCLVIQGESYLQHLLAKCNHFPLPASALDSVGHERGGQSWKIISHTPVVSWVLGWESPSRGASPYGLSFSGPSLLVSSGRWLS